MLGIGFEPQATLLCLVKPWSLAYVEHDLAEVGAFASSTTTVDLRNS